MDSVYDSVGFKAIACTFIQGYNGLKTYECHTFWICIHLKWLKERIIVLPLHSSVLLFLSVEAAVGNFYNDMSFTYMSKSKSKSIS